MRAALLAVALGLVALPAGAADDCVACHAGAAARSYALSKHGVIAGLDAGRPRQRAPTCAGCHDSEARAPGPKHFASPDARAQARSAASERCRECHAPRYVGEQLAAAQRSLAIGEMKLREAEAVVAAARAELAGASLARIETLRDGMRDSDMRALRLGLAHQSPDYQWWLGQAALDGSLLRIKGALQDARRTMAQERSAARR